MLFKAVDRIGNDELNLTDAMTLVSIVSKRNGQSGTNKKGRSVP